MQVMPIDLEAIIAIVMGISVVLIPVAGITARFALKPTVEALSKFFDTKGTEETVRILERRVSLMEQQLESMESTVEHLREVGAFQAELESGTEPDR